MSYNVLRIELGHEPRQTGQGVVGIRIHLSDIEISPDLPDVTAHGTVSLTVNEVGEVLGIVHGHPVRVKIDVVDGEGNYIPPAQEHKRAASDAAKEVLSSLNREQSVTLLDLWRDARLRYLQDIRDADATAAAEARKKYEQSYLAWKEHTDRHGRAFTFLP